MHKRSFKIVSVKNSNGGNKKFNPDSRFESANPIGAVKKALTKICQLTNVRGRCSFIITIKETTQGSNKKEFRYKAKRVKIDTQVVERGGVLVEYNYKSVVESY